MLFVLLNWCYLSITAFITGLVCLLPFERLGYRLRSVTGVWMAGLAALTVYAQIFSLFGGVGIGANLLLSCSVWRLRCLREKGLWDSGGFRGKESAG